MYCNELTEEEAKQMELFVKMRKETDKGGRGEVKKKKETDKGESFHLARSGCLFISSVCLNHHC